MKKAINYSITLIFTAVLLISSFVFETSAAGSTISFSNNKPNVNDSVTVTVTVDGGEPMYGTEFFVVYNPSVLRFEGGESANEESGAGRVTVVGTPGGASKQSYSLKFTAITAGSSTIQVTDGNYATDTEKPFTGSTATMTVSDAAKSNNANLKSLSLSTGTLSPAFSASKTSYTATVANSVTTVKVYATAQDSGAKVAISGESALKVGKNTRTVTVTAPSGAQKIYTITITRTEEDTSKPEESSEPESNPYEVSLNGTNYTVLNDISAIALPKGFSAAEAEYNGAAVSVAKDSDSNYTLYYLKSADGASTEPYTFNAAENTFERLQYAVSGDKFYILSEIPDDFIAPVGYYETSVKIGDFDVKALASSNSDYIDFYYVYCFYDGGYRMYCYDSKENVLQRAPDFKSAALVSEDDISQNKSFAARFASLSANAKTIVIGLFIAIIGAIALIVLLILRFVNKRKNQFDDYEDDILFRTDFDDVSISDGAAGEESTDKEKAASESDKEQ